MRLKGDLGLRFIREAHRIVYAATLSCAALMGDYTPKSYIKIVNTSCSPPRPGRNKHGRRAV